MNRKKSVVLLAFWLSMGLATLSVSFAADVQAKKPAITKPATNPDAQGKKDHCDEEMGEGHGHDMMGGHDGGMMGGHSSGMMVESPSMKMVRSLNLSDEQRSKIDKLSDELQHKNWATMGLIMDESAKLRDLYEADKRDPKTIGNEYQKIFDLKRQMIEAMLDTQNHIEELLTPEQLTQLKSLRHKMGSMHGHPMH